MKKRKDCFCCLTCFLTFMVVFFAAVTVTFAVPFPVPDTGQTTCYDDAFEGDILNPCPSPGETLYGQDAHYNINSPSYTKLDADGNDLPDSAAEWGMIRDNVTGLIWEHKTDDNTIHDKDNAYTWYDGNPATNGGNAGTPGDGTDTEDFIDVLNAQNFGGYSDWRLPNINELSRIVNYDKTDPTMDTTYFPNITAGVRYWSSTTDIQDADRVNTMSFWNGYGSKNLKSEVHHVCAVRGAAAYPLFRDNGDGTVSDLSTGLMWTRDVGDTDSDGDLDADDRVTWRDALAWCEDLTFAGYDDWRMPNFNELRSIMQYDKGLPAIDLNYFSDVLGGAGLCWTSTSYVSVHDTGRPLYEYAWLVLPGNGNFMYFWKGFKYCVRPVRNFRDNNIPPTADAGVNQNVKENTVAALDGSGSSDPDDGIAGYNWLQTAGPAVTLSDSSAVQPTFTVPSGAVGQPLTFQLTVTDNGGLTDTDTVTLTIAAAGVEVVWYQDGDGDGYGNPAVSEMSINQPAGFVADNTDCDDTDAAVNPGAVDACDGIDNDCDGLMDEGCLTWYQDADADGYGDPAAAIIAIDQPAGYVGDNTDCDDTDAAIHPGATEICGNGIDEDCSGADLACGGGGTNLAPVADAGEDRIVQQGVVTTLDGSDSYDPDGAIAAYIWEQTNGPAVTLSDASAVQPSFTVPGEVGAALTFRLTVTDTVGATDTDSVSLTISEDACNTQPNPPELISPADGAANVSLTPTLVTGDYSEPEECSTHFKTRWQISDQADFSGLTYNANTFFDELTAHQVTKKALKSNTTYYWRVKYWGDHGIKSEWSDIFTFTTGPEAVDANGNGVPDDQESPDTDVNENGIPDSQEPNLRVLLTPDGDSIGLEFGDDVLSIAIEAMSEDEIGDIDNMPGNFLYGLIAFRVMIANPGATVSFTVYLPQAAPANAVWYKYDTVNGWYDFTGQVTFSPNRKSLTFTLTDGGTGDADGVANGTIVDPAGLSADAETPGHSSSSSCFIDTCAF